MDNLQYLKFDNAFFMALLEDGKLLESNEYFNLHLNQIKNLKIDKKRKFVKEEEFKKSLILYVNGLIKKAEEYNIQSNYAKSIICYEIASKYNSKVYEDVLVLKIFIKCLIKTNQKDLANDMIEHYIQITNSNPNEYKYLAEMFDLMGDNKNSTKFMEEYLNSKNSDEITADEYNLCGLYYNRLYFDDYSNISIAQKSIEFFEKAHRINPNSMLYLHNITILARYTNDYEKSNKAWQKLLKMGELSEIQKYDYALLCMKLPNFTDWHKYYGARYSSDLEKYAFHSFKQPLWDGIKDISNSTLLLHWEQGYGDNILMYGYINRILNRAKQIKFVVPDPLYNLLKNNNDKIEIIQNSTFNPNFHKFDYYLPIMSLPKILNISRETVSVGEGYISVNENIIKKYKDKYFCSDKYKIGIAFNGNKNINIIRNIPIKYFAELNKLKDVDIFILNKDIPDKDLDIFTNNNAYNIAKTFHNFEDTAAAIKNCNIIITSDNCIMNLAAAVGKKTFCLFNWSSEWRWFDLSGDDVVWYTNVKPFVNTKMNDWKPTMEKVVTELEKYIK